MTFKQYLEALEHGDMEAWVTENMTNGGDFSKYKMQSILKQAHSDGECPIHKFKIYRDVNELVFGQFMFIEAQLSNNENVGDRLFSIAKYILRPIHHEIFDNEDIQIEESNSNAILEQSCEDILRVINKYMIERNKFIHETYDGVFYKSKKDNDEDDDEEQNVSNGMEGDAAWYWYSLRRTLAKEDIHKYAATMMLKMDMVAPEIAYMRREERKREYERKVEELKRTARNGTR